MYKKLKDGLNALFTVSTKISFVVVLLSMASISMLFSMRKTVVLSIDGNDRLLMTYRKDVKSLLKTQNIIIGPKDKIMPDIDSLIKDGDRIDIKKAIQIHVIVDGKKITLNTSEATIAGALSAEGITYCNLDKIDPMPTEHPKEGMNVSITRVETKLVKEYQSIDFPTVIKKDNTLMNTVKKIAQEGKSGEREITFRVMFENGVQVSKKIVQEIITVEPTERVLLQGTLTLSLSRGGEVSKKNSSDTGLKETFSLATPADLSYNSVIKCVATAYSSQQPGIGTIAASGKSVKRNPNGYSTIAVDPRVIPIGTRVFVEGYGYATAEDTGGAIKGNKIDVYLHTVADCYNWGRRTVNVYILK